MDKPSRLGVAVIDVLGLGSPVDPREGAVGTLAIELLAICVAGDANYLVEATFLSGSGRFAPEWRFLLGQPQSQAAEEAIKTAIREAQATASSLQAPHRGDSMEAMRKDWLNRHTLALQTPQNDLETRRGAAEGRGFWDGRSGCWRFALGAPLPSAAASPAETLS